jgi:nitroimidazol reductase NimA-like FMN-containing flavoprotein (pyridoxamine 5'-phosphate oxidase superfamily)
MSREDTAPSPRTRLKRLPERGAYDRETIHAILDEGFLCHVACTTDAGHAAVIPTVYGRQGDVIYLHGSTANRIMRRLRSGAEACVSVTHVDALVLARSAFHHSVNFRSVVLYGTAYEVTDAAEKLAALRAVVDHVFPERWNEIRGPSSQELNRTMVLGLALDEASAKLRSGPPVDEEGDYERDCWAGLIPMRTEYGAPLACPRLAEGIEAPDNVMRYRRRADERARFTSPEPDGSSET